MRKLPYLLVVFTCLVIGCGSPSVVLTPVTGTVTIDGKPAEGILVRFVPDTLDETMIAPTSQALTDNAGNYDLFTVKNERGAVLGLHSVSLIDTLEERPEQGKQATKKPRLDGKFALSGFSVEVVEGQPIELKATGPK